MLSFVGNFPRVQGERRGVGVPILKSVVTLLLGRGRGCRNSSFVFYKDERSRKPRTRTWDILCRGDVAEFAEEKAAADLQRKR